MPKKNESAYDEDSALTLFQTEDQLRLFLDLKLTELLQSDKGYLEKARELHRFATIYRRLSAEFSMERGSGTQRSVAEALGVNQATTFRWHNDPLKKSDLKEL